MKFYYFSMLVLIILLFSNFNGFIKEDRGTIKIELHKIKNTDGHIIISLYNKSEGFPSEKSASLLDRKYKITGDKLICEFVEIPYGEYAIAILHDENDNGELDKNIIGIPKEGIGVSNDAIRSFGPPKYDEARFELKSREITLEVNMHYY